MIHAFAIEPELVATWGSLPEFRHFCERFGLGTPRILLEIPKFTEWRSAVLRQVQGKGLPVLTETRIVELLKVFAQHRHRRSDAPNDDLPSWHENAEREHARREFAAILARGNPNSHRAVLGPQDVHPSQARWACATGIVCPRTPKDIAAALAPMLTNCREAHVVDPYFAPAEQRYSDVLVALTDILASAGTTQLRVHLSHKQGEQWVPLIDFNKDAATLAPLLASGFRVEFARWRKRPKGEQLHNRYVLTNVGGVSFGTGLDSGQQGTTDDLTLLTREQYKRRWDQYAAETGFDLVDRPTTVVGTRP